MDTLDERFAIYSALVILCAVASAFLGLIIGAWTFVQMALVIEFMYWIGGFGRDKSAAAQ